MSLTPLFADVAVGKTAKVYLAAEVEAALGAAREERDKLKLELEGDGSRGSDALTSLGLRACFELRGENIALLNAEKDAAEASLSALRQLLARALDTMEDMAFALDQEFAISTDPPDEEYNQFFAEIRQALAAPASPQEKK